MLDASERQGTTELRISCKSVVVNMRRGRSFGAAALIRRTH